MKRIGIYGASDDLVELEVDGVPLEELPAYNRTQTVTFAAAEKMLVVDARHDGKRGWVLSAIIEDDTEEGDLPFRVSLVQHHYSPMLIIETNVPVTITWFDDGGPTMKTVRP